MNSRLSITVTRWTLAFGALAGIVLVFEEWLPVNPTTVALTLLLFILLLAAKWGLRYAVVISLLASACYNFFFLPPIKTFTISDPQNWLALFAFLSTSIIASRLSERARNEASEARLRQRELEILFRLSSEMLQLENTSTLLTSVPAAVASVTEARACTFYLIEGEKLYQAGTIAISEVELPHIRQLALSLNSAEADADEIHIPIRTGVRPRGLLTLRSVSVSLETAEAIGRLVSIAIERAQALESIARDEARKESERLRTLMIDSITHELRTPLTSIKGAATALLAGDVRREESHELLTIIDEESDSLNKLISEAVEMVQLDAQQVQMHFISASVSEIVEGALTASSWVRDQHPIYCEIPAHLRVRADPTVLQKVICNLIENAAKYSAPDSPITIGAEPRGDTVAISVADRGIGIDSSEQALIFERFYRSRSRPDGAAGTGMGLAISHAITEAHGGHITVTSQLGQGSVFTVNIPVGTT